MSLSPQWLDELRARITLSAVIGRTTRLTKAGHEFKACCPFHNEKSPSFTVNDLKGFYHCFGCGAHGDAIRWMTDQRGLSFMDAVKELASEAGLEVPAPDPRAAQIAEKQSGLHEVMQAAQDWYRAQLETPAGTKARDYLNSRQFDAHTMERFGFGFAPAGRQALKAALSQFDEAMLIEAGLRIAVDDKEPYDRFRDRLTMPIQDARGRVIGFAARILDADKKDAPKYLNSPDTPLFDKGRTLFNLHRAGPASRQSGRIVVVEGQMDVVALAAAGLADAVAPMGTALTERQLEMLWRLVEAPVLCFDGDSAGQRAAMRAITRALPMLRPAHTLRICRLPTGLDPDDLIKQQGVGALEQVLSGAKSLVETLWENERDSVPLDTPEDKAGLKARLMAHVDTIADQDIKALYRRELLKLFSAFAFPPRDWSAQSNVVSITDARGWAASQYKRKFGDLPQTAFPGPASKELTSKHEKQTDRQKHLHRRLGAMIVAGLLNYPKLAIVYAESLLQVRELDTRLEIIAEAAYDDVLEPDRIMAIFESKALNIPSESEWDHMRIPFTWPPPDAEGAVFGLEKALKLYAGLPQIETALNHATEKLGIEFNEARYDEQQRLLRRAMEFKAELRNLATAAA